MVAHDTRSLLDHLGSLHAMSVSVLLSSLNVSQMSASASSSGVSADRFWRPVVSSLRCTTSERG